MSGCPDIGFLKNLKIESRGTKLSRWRKFGRRGGREPKATIKQYPAANWEVFIRTWSARRDLNPSARRYARLRLGTLGAGTDI
jgi:hypothetical protein